MSINTVSIKFLEYINWIHIENGRINCYFIRITVNNLNTCGYVKHAIYWFIALLHILCWRIIRMSNSHRTAATAAKLIQLTASFVIQKYVCSCHCNLCLMPGVNEFCLNFQSFQMICRCLNEWAEGETAIARPQHEPWKHARARLTVAANCIPNTHPN